MEETETLARFAKALGHPTRIKILNYLESQSCCYTGDLLEVLPLAQSTISQHLTVIGNAGLLQGRFEGKKKCYCLNIDRFQEAQMILNSFFKKTANKCC